MPLEHVWYVILFNTCNMCTMNLFAAQRAEFICAEYCLVPIGKVHVQCVRCLHTYLGKVKQYKKERGKYL